MRVAAAFFISFLCFVLLATSAEVAEPLASNQNVIHFQWESRDRSFLDAQRDLLNDQGGRVGQVREKDPGTKNPAAIALLVVTGVTAVSALADAIVRALKDYQHGGLVVDMQGPEVKVIESQSLERGQTLIRKPNGDVVSYAYKSESTQDLTAVIGGLLANVKNP